MTVLQFSAFKPELRFDAFEPLGAGDILECGWLALDDHPERTKASRRKAAAAKASEAARAEMMPFAITGHAFNEDATKVCLWDCWKPALGRDYLGIHQLTGSCVGAGGGNALFSLAAADVIKRRDPEKAVIPLWLLPYGISRMLDGMNDRGEGSSGSAFAKAAREYGHIPADTDGCPKFVETDGIIWSEKAELDWSQGKKIPQKYLDAAKIHLVKTTAECSNADAVRDAIKSYFSVTIASDWGGQMRPGTSGTPPVLLNKRVTNWSHQMSVQAWWDHPSLGEIFWIQNQWGIDTHGRCPSGAPGGGFWVLKKEIEWICNSGEVFAMSQFDGFPAPVQPLDFSAF